MAGWLADVDTVRKRVKVEFQDESGTKYSLAVEGRVSREKVLKIMDLMDLVVSSLITRRGLISVVS